MPWWSPTTMETCWRATDACLLLGRPNWHPQPMLEVRVSKTYQTPLPQLDNGIHDLDGTNSHMTKSERVLRDAEVTATNAAVAPR